MSSKKPASSAVASLVDEVVLVDDDDLLAATDLVAETLGVLVEPSGAAGVAALSRHGPEIAGERVAVLLTGRGELRADGRTLARP